MSIVFQFFLIALVLLYVGSAIWAILVVAVAILNFLVI